MMKTILISFTAIFFFLVSCKKENVSVNTNQEFALPYQQSATITDEKSGEKVKIKFEEVIEDSRCPEGARCFWGGRVRLKLLVDEKPVEITTISIYVSPNGPGNDTSGVLEHNGFKILLLNVKPYPLVNTNIKTKKYEALLKVLK